jgi:hypothetical protein
MAAVPVPAPTDGARSGGDMREAPPAPNPYEEEWRVMSIRRARMGLVV